MALEISISEQIFNYKKIPHLLQYTKELGTIEKILKSKSFKPSYCKENFGNDEILIPMVSFCNIPLSQVSNFLYYGDYGIGLSLDWGIDKGIEPVKYEINFSSIEINNKYGLVEALNILTPSNSSMFLFKATEIKGPLEDLREKEKEKLKSYTNKKHSIFKKLANKN